ncbi:MAG: UDP-N-acetylmuramate dehydrogenase [Clostridia bacterium]|nr:UDP-N-acetylmuramate dehydrogenase [Clostridia bacterium]
MENYLQDLQQLGIDFCQNCPLSAHSTFRIGGAARVAVFPNSREQMLQCLSLLRERDLPFLVVGNASNVVFPDEGFSGVVVFTGQHREISVQGNRMLVGAGATLASVAMNALSHSLCGAEFAQGIPGTLGGGIFMNAGAFGGCMDQICALSEYYDLSTGSTVTLVGEEQAFSTRDSFYQHHPEAVILGATLQLKQGDPQEIRAIMEDYRQRRRSTQPLELPSAGSVFKRPVGHFAGKLIQDCGLKGMTVGGAQVSEKHAGFIVNRGGATAGDVKRLVEQIREIVLRETGVTLECEIQFL